MCTSEISTNSGDIPTPSEPKINTTGIFNSVFLNDCVAFSVQEIKLKPIRFRFLSTITEFVAWQIGILSNAPAEAFIASSLIAAEFFLLI